MFYFPLCLACVFFMGREGKAAREKISKAIKYVLFSFIVQSPLLFYFNLTFKTYLFFFRIQYFLFLSAVLFMFKKQRATKRSIFLIFLFDSLSYRTDYGSLYCFTEIYLLLILLLLFFFALFRKRFRNYSAWLLFAFVLILCFTLLFPFD